MSARAPGPTSAVAARDCAGLSIGDAVAGLSTGTIFGAQPAKPTAKPRAKLAARTKTAAANSAAAPVAAAAPAAAGASAAAATGEATRFGSPCELSTVVQRTSFSADHGMHMHVTPSPEVKAILARRGCEARRMRVDLKNFTNKKVRSRVVVLAKTRDR